MKHIILFQSKLTILRKLKPFGKIGNNTSAHGVLIFSCIYKTVKSIKGHSSNQFTGNGCNFTQSFTSYKKWMNGVPP